MVFVKRFVVHNNKLCPWYSVNYTETCNTWSSWVDVPDNRFSKNIHVCKVCLGLLVCRTVICHAEGDSSDPVFGTLLFKTACLSFCEMLPFTCKPHLTPVKCLVTHRIIYHSWIKLSKEQCFFLDMPPLHILIHSILFQSAGPYFC